MKILYTSDLHGTDHYYNTIWKKAQLHKVNVVVNGGDLLPKTNPVLKRQQGYIKYLGRTYFPRFEKAGIHYVFILGNDDCKVFDPEMIEICSKFEYVHLLQQSKIEINGFDFVGFDLVCDYPFGIKDRCRMDNPDFEFPEQRSTPGYAVKKEHGVGWDNIEDWFETARRLPTLEDELKALVKPRDMRKAIYVMHMPPAGIGLDLCYNEDRPAGHSVLQFLIEEQPLLSLHGHIHESYQMTSIWKSPIGKTWAVQPGQGGQYPVYCVIDTDNLTGMKRFGHKSERLFLGPYDSLVKINGLPEYLQYHVRLFLAEKGIPLEPEMPFPLFQKFIREKGLNIQLNRG